MKKDIDSLVARKADRIAIDEMGIPSLDLMFNASKAVADFVMDNYPKKKILIVCGTGNNGADGLCAASILREKGFDTTVNILGEIEKGSWEFYYQLSQYKQLKGVLSFNEKEVIDHDVLLDGLFGVGLSRKIEGKYYDYIEKLNAYQSVKVAIDVPSGLNPDNGTIMGICLKADVTITFGRNKCGFKDSAYTGRVIVKDIGIPDDVYESLLTKQNDESFKSESVL